MIETFIHEEYVSKRREQRRMQQLQQQQHQQRRRRPMKSLQIQTDKGKPMKLPAASSAAEGQQSPREQHQPATAYRSPVGSPTADAATFRDHLFDYLKPY